MHLDGSLKMLIGQGKFKISETIKYEGFFFFLRRQGILVFCVLEGKCYILLKVNMLFSFIQAK